MSTLAELRARLLARLVSSPYAVWATDRLDEGLRSALSDYTAARPLTSETVVVLPGAGREVALNGLDGLLLVTDVWWPYDSLSEIWPPNKVTGFRVWWDDAQPVLFLNTRDRAQPQTGDELRLWYTKAHTLQDLDGGALTTVFGYHETGLVTGAAGYAAAAAAMTYSASAAADREAGRPVGAPLGSTGQARDAYRALSELRLWSAARLAEFAGWLDGVRAGAPSGGDAFSAGWALDRYDDAQR